VDSLCSPLTPDVRRACAARSSARAVPRLHRTFARPAVPPRGRSASPHAAHIGARPNQRASAHGPSQSSRRSPTACAHHRHGGRHIPRVSRFIPRLRPSGPSALRSLPLRIGVWLASGDRRKPRNAQLRSPDGLGFRSASSTRRRSRPGPIPRSSAAAVFINPPRNHSVAPNPGMQRTRYARR
jgi:hypothetical protein